MAKISACYMVKNEGSRIEKSLQSIQSIVDEIVLVDTGSVDDTIAIARKYGAVIYSYPWNDDFSAPRNFALSKATGDWIIFMDADEYLPEECLKPLQNIIQEQFKLHYNGGLLIRRYDIDVDKNNEILADTLVLRVFSRMAGRHYQGLIHEEVWDNGEPINKLLIVPREQVWFMHTGYCNSMTKSKAQRNLTLLEKELAMGTNPERLYMYLADVYLGLGEMDKAWHYAWLDVKLGRRAITYASRSYRILLELSLKGKTDLHGRWELCCAAVRDFPESPEFRADLAECLATLGNYQEAAEMMATAIEAYENYQGIEPMLMTAEVAGIAASRGKLFARLAVKQREYRGMLITALCAMRDEEYWHTDTKKILAPVYQQIMDCCHGEKIPAEFGEYSAAAYIDCVKYLLDNRGEIWVEKLLRLAGNFSADTRQQVLALLDKKIKQEGG